MQSSACKHIVQTCFETNVLNSKFNSMFKTCCETIVTNDLKFKLNVCSFQLNV